MRESDSTLSSVAYRYACWLKGAMLGAQEDRTQPRRVVKTDLLNALMMRFDYRTVSRAIRNRNTLPYWKRKRGYGYAGIEVNRKKIKQEMCLAPQSYLLKAKVTF